jgi:tetratricopeptide (TPR) repeat protein
MAQHGTRLKLRRKDLRQPDELATLTGRTMSWAREQRRVLVGVAAAALVVAVILAVAARVRANRHAAAAAAFGAAHASFEAGKFQESGEAFAGVARDYPSAPYGRLAGLYRGHALARQGEAQAASAAYAEYLATSPDPPYVRQEALAALARTREDSGDSPGALEAYTKASALEGPYRTDAVLGAARVHEALGHSAEARQLYSDLLKEASDPDLRALLLSKVPPIEIGEQAPGAPSGPSGGNVR